MGWFLNFVRVNLCPLSCLHPLDNTFEVGLLKNTSGLGFSFSREENVPGEPVSSSMVRVKKLFPGQPAAESGRNRSGRRHSTCQSDVTQRPVTTCALTLYLLHSKKQNKNSIIKTCLLFFGVLSGGDLCSEGHRTGGDPSLV